MTDSALQTTDAPQVPALRTDTDASVLDARDLAFPRLYIGQAISEAVENELVKSGDIFVATGGDDPDPVVLAKRGSEEGVLFHVLGLRKGISRSIDGILETWAWGDPVAPVPSPATKAWVTYQYFIAVPSADDELPLRFLLTRSGRSAAQKINTVLARLQGVAPSHSVAFSLTTAQRSNDKGSWYVPRIVPAEGTAESAYLAEKLAPLVANLPTQTAAPAGEEGPAI